MDRPGARSLHSQPIPRLGGVAIFLVVFLLLTLARVLAAPFSFAGLWPLLGPAAGVFSLGVVEDYRQLSPSLRMTIQVVLAATAVILSGSPIPLVGIPVLDGLLAVLVICWMTNLYNFMDGSDGLAGGMAAIGFAALGVAAWRRGMTDISTVALVVSVASAGFLGHNWAPARVFMGDAGSTTLGFLAGAMGTAFFPGSVVQPLLAFAPFIVDGTITLLRRVATRKRFWQPHREHYYQRLILNGWTHGRTAGFYYMLMLASAIGSIAYEEVGRPIVGAVLLVNFLPVVALRWSRTEEDTLRA